LWFSVIHSILNGLICPLAVLHKTTYYRIFVKETRDKKTENQNPDFKNYQIKRRKTPGWEADVSPPFLKVHFPKKLRSASKF